MVTFGPENVKERKKKFKVFFIFDYIMNFFLQKNQI